MIKKTVIAVLAVFIGASVYAAGTKADAWLRYANQMYRSGKYDKAIKAYEYVIKSNPNNVKVLVYAAYCYAATGDYRSALVKLRAAYEVSHNKKIYAMIEKYEKQVSTGAKQAQVGTGGTARLQALGGVNVVVPDNAAIIDSAADGFTSAFAFRPYKSFMDITLHGFMPSVKTVEDNASETTYEEKTYGGAINYREKDNGVLVWLSQNNLIIIRPFFDIGLTTVKNIDSGATITHDDTFYLTYPLEFEFAQKIIDNLSLGVMAGYIKYEGSTEDKLNEPDETGMIFDKIEYLVTASYRLQLGLNNLVFSAGGGSKGPNFIQNLLIYDGLNPFYGQTAVLYGHYNMIQTSFTENAIVRTETEQKTAYSGTDVFIGASYEFAGMLEASAKAGFTSGMKADTTGKTTVTLLATGDSTDFEIEPYTSLDSGSQATFDLRARFITDYVIAAGAFKTVNTAYDFYTSAADTTADNRSMSLTDISGGITLTLLENVLIPIEPFMQTAELRLSSPADIVYTLSAAGIRGGVEFQTGKASAIRFGADYTTGGEMYDIGGATSDPIGSDTNPAYNIIGFNAGFGAGSEIAEFNLTFRYEMKTQSPEPEGYKEWSDINMMILVGIRSYT